MNRSEVGTMRIITTTSMYAELKLQIITCFTQAVTSPNLKGYRALPLYN